MSGPSRPFRRGLIMGKFMPFHLGHKALIDFALTQVDHLEIAIVSKAQEPIPMAVRKQWIDAIYRGAPVTASLFTHDLPHDGRFTESDMQAWCQAIASRFGHVDAFISSEAYGEVLAAHMGIPHVLFESDRSTFPISATQIRENPSAFSHYLPKVVADYYNLQLNLRSDKEGL